MSVIKFSVVEFADIASTIRYDTVLRDHFLSLKEVGKLSKLKMYPPTEQQLDKAILCWVERLYIANALAFEYQYGDSEIISIKRLAEKDLEGQLLRRGEILEKLRGLRYNVFTNAGRTFLGEDDMAKLSALIQLIQDYREMKMEGFV
jgi:ribosomal protein L27